jgi:acyl-CoA synthetase (AMP-forming)/AMP-acid ligase II
MVKDASGIGRLRLFVGARDIDPRALESYLKSKLPDYMWPASITVLPELPLNLNGKIDRPALAKMA